MNFFALALTLSPILPSIATPLQFGGDKSSGFVIQDVDNFQLLEDQPIELKKLGALEAIGEIASIIDQFEQDQLTSFLDGFLHEMQDEQALSEPPPGRGFPPVIDLSSFTLLQIFNYSLHRDEDENLPIHKFSWLANLTTALDEDDYKKYNVRSYVDYLKIAEEHGKDVTILVPDDSALTPPKKKHGEQPDDWMDELLGDDNGGLGPLGDPFRYILDLKAADPGIQGKPNEKLIKKALAALSLSFAYSTLPDSLTFSELSDLSTSATYLPSYFYTEEDGKEKFGDPLRVKFSVVPGPIPVLTHRLKVNIFTGIRGPGIKAKNGFIHLLSAPLSPPLPPIKTTLLFPQIYSTFTSSIQQAGLDGDPNDFSLFGKVEDWVDEILEKYLESFKRETKDYTLFVPTNNAWARLGLVKNALLHSSQLDFILRRLLSYHTVPGVTFFSDYVYNHSSASLVSPYSQEFGVSVDRINDLFGGQDWDSFYPDEESVLGDDQTLFSWLSKPPKVPPKPTPPLQVNISHYLLSTLYGEEDRLNVSVVQYRTRLGHGPVERRLFVTPAWKHDEDEESFEPRQKEPKTIPVVINDGVAKGGSIQTLGGILYPPPSFLKL